MIIIQDKPEPVLLRLPVEVKLSKIWGVRTKQVLNNKNNCKLRISLFTYTCV